MCMIFYRIQIIRWTITSHQFVEAIAFLKYFADQGCAVCFIRMFNNFKAQ